ncbi:MAG: hypothetical protein WC069_05790 [Candidatus Shapirobacteria bacterium]
MKKTKNQFVRTPKQLKELIKEGHNNFALVLAGGLGIYSRKTIKYSDKTKQYSITNHIDNSKQKLTEKELMNESYTLIGKALKLKSLIAIIN